MDKLAQCVANVAAIMFQVLLAIICIQHAGVAQSAPQYPAGVPGTGDAIRQTVPPLPSSVDGNSKDLEVPLTLEAEPERAIPFAESETLLVKKFVLAGASDDDEERLQAILAPDQARELTMKDINNAARKVTNYYRERGYLVARVLVPKQSVRSGALTLKIVLGSYGQIKVKNSSHLHQKVVNGVFERMKRDSPELTQDSLERAMILLKETPGGSMPSVSVKSGKEAGTTDMMVSVDGSRRFHGYLLGDNQGSQYTGRKRIYGGIDMESPMGIGDVFSLAAMTTDDEGLKNGRASYGIPLNYDGLRFTVSYTRTTYTLGGAYALLGGTGTADVAEGTLSYPIRRRGNESIDLLVNWDHKKLHDDLKTVDTHNPRNADLGILTVQRTKSGKFLQRNVITTMSVSIAAGQLAVVDATQRSLSGTDGTYGKLNVRATSEYALSKKISQKTTLQMQKDISDKILDSSEQLFISGSGGVRAYAESASGDNGYVLNTEFRYMLPALIRPMFQHAVAIFFDNGGVQAQKSGTVLTNYVLSDTGVGYSINFHSAFVNTQVARSLGPIKQHNETDHTHVWLQLGYVF